MPIWLKTSLLAWLLSCFCLLNSQPVQADGIAVRRAEATISGDHLLVSTRFGVALPPTLQDALQQGVPLSFRLEFELTRPRFLAYMYQFRDWFEPNAEITFKISYYKFTNQYRMTIGSLSSHYMSLNDAMAALGAIAGWQVMNVSDWDKGDRVKVAGRVRLILDTADLPRPFQLNALGSKDWNLSSDWINLNVKDTN